MKVFFTKDNKVVQRETTELDIWTKRYTIRIRISGVVIVRHARPKKHKPEMVVYDESLNLTG